MAIYDNEKHHKIKKLSPHKIPQPSLKSRKYLYHREI